MVSNRIAVGAVVAGLAPFIVLGPNVALAEEVPAAVVQQEDNEEEYEELSLPEALQPYDEAVDSAWEELQQAYSDAEEAGKKCEQLGTEYEEINKEYQEARDEADSAQEELAAAYSDLLEDACPTESDYDERGQLDNVVQYLSQAYEDHKLYDEVGEENQEMYLASINSALEELKTLGINVESEGEIPTTDELEAALTKATQAYEAKNASIEKAEAASELLSSIDLNQMVEEDDLSALDAFIDNEALAEYKSKLQDLKEQATALKEKLDNANELYDQVQEKEEKYLESIEEQNELAKKVEAADAKHEAAINARDAAVQKYADELTEDAIKPVVDKNAPVSKVIVNTDLSEVKGLFDEFDYYTIAELDAETVVELRVQEADLTDSEKQSILEKLAQKAGNAVEPIFMDISLVKSIGEYDFMVSETKSPISISIALPDNLKPVGGENRVYLIVRLHDGKVDILDASYDPTTGLLTFETDKFSTYGITYYDKDADSGTKKSGPTEASSANSLPQTGDPFNSAVPIALAAGAIAMVGTGKHMRRKEQRG